MKRLKTISIILPALAALLFVLTGQHSLPVNAQNAQTSKITGVVLDANDARIASATIRIENARFSREIQSTDEGNFEFELPEGTYQITIEKDGFRRFKLSDFRVPEQSRERLSVRLKVMPPRGTLKVE